jgi:hypothetical protein
LIRVREEDFNAETQRRGGDATVAPYEGIKTRMRFNAVVETGVRGFIPRGK